MILILLQDFFYVCNVHLSDRAFASPLKDEEAEKRKAAEALQRETEKLMKEFEEKKRQKEAKKKEKQKEKEKSKTKQEGDGKGGTKTDEKDQEDSKVSDEDVKAQALDGCIHVRNNHLICGTTVR